MPAPGEVRDDLEPADLVPVDLVVIAAVGIQVLGATQRLAALAADRRDGLDQRDQLGDVVAVAAGGGRGERDAVRLDDQVVLAAGLAPVHRAGLRPAARRAAARAGAARPRPRSSLAAVVSRSFRMSTDIQSHQQR